MVIFHSYETHNYQKVVPVEFLQFEKFEVLIILTEFLISAQAGIQPSKSRITAQVESKMVENRPFAQTCETLRFIIASSTWDPHPLDSMATTGRLCDCHMQSDIQMPAPWNKSSARWGSYVAVGL